MKFFLLLFLALGHARAGVIQILHTNDLHTYLEGTNRGRGGYARLKTFIEQKRAEAKREGIPSLYLDGGDFGEGSSFFAAEQGALSFRALDLLGPDASVLGNHDHILGATELASVLRRSGVKTTILSANLSGDPIKTALPLLERAKNDKIDFVIALSHAGIDVDRELVEKSSGLGLIVGGHDHLVFDAPRITTDKRGREVPILQAGAHGAFVGELLIDIGPDGSAKVLRYTLHEISPTTPEDPEMRNLISAAKVARSEHFNRNWDEVIGESAVTLTGRVEGRMKNNRSCWSAHVARMERLAGGADVGLQFDVFQSDEIPAGAITFGNLIDNFVHFNDWNPRGWELATLRLSGAELDVLLGLLRSTNNEYSATVDGIEVQNEDGTFSRFRPIEHHKRKKFVGGKPLRKFHLYTLTLPREVPRAFEKNVPILGKLLTRYQRTPRLYVWEELEKYVRQNSPISCDNI